MHDPDEPDSKTWELHLEPGQQVNKKLVVTDPACKSGLKYAYGFKVSQKVGSEEELMQLIREKGKCKEIDFEGVAYKVSFTTHFLKDTFYFLYENLEEKAVFDGTFKFNIKNLEILDNEDQSEVAVKL